MSVRVNEVTRSNSIFTQYKIIKLVWSYRWPSLHYHMLREYYTRTNTHTSTYTSHYIYVWVTLCAYIVRSASIYRGQCIHFKLLYRERSTSVREMSSSTSSALVVVVAAVLLALTLAQHGSLAATVGPRVIVVGAGMSGKHIYMCVIYIYIYQTRLPCR